MYFWTLSHTRVGRRHSSVVRTPPNKWCGRRLSLVTLVVIWTARVRQPMPKNGILQNRFFGLFVFSLVVFIAHGVPYCVCLFRDGHPCDGKRSTEPTSVISLQETGKTAVVCSKSSRRRFRRRRRKYKSWMAAGAAGNYKRSLARKESFYYRFESATGAFVAE